MNTDTRHVDRFIEQLGRLAESESLPRTAGRMMGILIVSGTPLGIDDLAQRLSVSRASVSTNSRLLQSLGIARLVSEPGSRRDYLQINGDSCSSLLALGLRRMRSMRVAVRELRLAMHGAQTQGARNRLRRIENFYDTAIQQVESVLGDWHDPELGTGILVGNIGNMTSERVSNARAHKKLRQRRAT